MRESEATRLVAKIKASWPRDPLPPETAEAYVECLLDLDVDVAEVALRRAQATLTYRPAIAEMRKLAAQELAGMPTAGDAWGEVRRAIFSAGRARKPKWSHPAIARVVDAMGWIELCDSKGPSGVIRGQFLRMYEEVTERVWREVAAEPLIAASKEKPLLRAPETPLIAASKAKPLLGTPEPRRRDAVRAGQEPAALVERVASSAERGRR